MITSILTAHGSSLFLFLLIFLKEKSNKFKIKQARPTESNNTQSENTINNKLHLQQKFIIYIYFFGFSFFDEKQCTKISSLHREIGW